MMKNDTFRGSEILKKIAEFLVGSGFGGANFTIGAADVNFDGRDEIVIGGN